ncbi:hypothetical protein, partial [Luteimicrobium sp. DT211]|uniref:hypothetical protein n=1 Tax=Luteimicrobium sp. DT211 TaxID=3393412 RepID=UPI003CF8B872
MLTRQVHASLDQDPRPTIIDPPHRQSIGDLRQLREPRREAEETVGRPPRQAQPRPDRGGGTVDRGTGPARTVRELTRRTRLHRQRPRPQTFRRR